MTHPSPPPELGCGHNRGPEYIEGDTKNNKGTVTQVSNVAKGPLVLQI